MFEAKNFENCPVLAPFCNSLAIIYSPSLQDRYF